MSRFLAARPSMLFLRVGRSLQDSIGLWSWYSFGYWTSTQLYPVTQDIWWLNQYLPRFLLCAVCAVVLWHGAHRPGWAKIVRVAALDRTSLAASLTALIILSVVPYTARTVGTLFLATLFIGFQNAWNIVRWGSLYAQSSGRHNLTRVLIAVIAIACVKLLTLILPVIATALLLAALLGWTHWHARTTAPDVRLYVTPAVHGAEKYEVLDGHTLLSLWQTWLSVALFFVLWSFLNMGLVNAVGHITDDPGIPWASVLTQAIDIGFAAFLLHWAAKDATRSVDWSLFWQCAFFVLALGLLSISLWGPTRIAQVFVSASAVLVFMFTEYLCIQVGSRTALPPGVVIGTGFAVVSLLDWAVRGIVVLTAITVDAALFVPLMLFGVLVTIVFFLPARSPGMQLLTAEFVENSPNHALDIESHCRRIAQTHGLASRETDVLILLARGRSIPYIAETLYLTENTAKTYRQRIYAKLGVHSKQELLDLVEQP